MYPFFSVYKQEQTLYTFHHNKLTNDHLYEKFTTNYDAANTIGVTIQNKVLLEHVSQENHCDAFENITEKQQKTVGSKA